MSNYSQITSFGPKDTLLTGDPNKKIKGTQIDAELAAIATAITSKYDATNIASVTLAVGDGTVSLPAWTFSADTDTGVYRIGANEIGVAVGGVKTLDVASGLITAFNTNFAGVATLAGTNTSTTATQDMLAQLTAGSSVFKALVANQGRATAVVTNGPTAAQAALFTTGAIPLVFGTNGTYAGQITSVGGWVVAAPSSGSALTVGGAVDIETVVLTGGTNSASNKFVQTITSGATAGKSSGLAVTAATNASDTALLIRSQSAVNNFMQLRGDGSGYIGYNGTAQTLSFAAAGTVSLATPASGVPLTVNGTTATHGIDYTDGTITQAVGFTSGGTAFSGTTSNHPFNLLSNGSTRLAIAAGGAITIGAPTSGVALSATGVADIETVVLTGGTNSANNKFVQTITSGTTAGKSSGLAVSAGTNASDTALLVRNASGTTNFLQITGAGVISGAGPVAAALVDMTPDTGTFTFTITGCTTAPTGTGKWVRSGNLVLLFVPSIFATSNTTALTFTGMPAAIQPATTQSLAVPALVAEDSGAPSDLISVKVTAASGTLTFLISNSATSFTNTGGKGVLSPFTVAYLLN